MKKIIAFCAIGISVHAGAQSVTPQVVATSGDYYNGSSANLSWTLGEVAIDTYVGSSNQLTQGFQQPEIRFSELENFAQDLVVSLYPNPATSLVNLQIANNSETLQLQMYDASGKLILSGIYVSNENHPIYLTGLADGFYLLKISSPTSGLLKTLKIQKN